MNKADCFHLGYVAKLHGFKGEVSLFLDVSNPEDYADLEMVFIEINNQLTPFFIDSFKLKNKGFAAVKFEGVDTENDARFLQRKSLYLPAEILPELSGTSFYDHEIVGFTVVDTNFGEVGVAVLIAKPGAKVDPDAVIAALKSQLANFKIPKKCFVVAELPRNTMGKVQKNLLREEHKGLFA